MNNDFKNIKAVLFDFDDTLGHRESYAYDTFYRLLKSCTDFEDEMELEAILQDVMIWDEQGNIHKQHIVDMLKKKYPCHAQILKSGGTKNNGKLLFLFLIQFLRWNSCRKNISLELLQMVTVHVRETKFNRQDYLISLMKVM